LRVGILGSGFGLYGYLPALMNNSNTQIFLPERYKRNFSERNDLRRFASQIDWLEDEDAVITSVDALIISKRPADQVKWIDKCSTVRSLKHLLLEKPIAPDPVTSARILRQLYKTSLTVRIGYIFRYTQWGKALLQSQSQGRLQEPLEIKWIFRAHHYVTEIHNWKRLVSSGGGALRFFGIHLIALLAEMGYDSVSDSTTATHQKGEAAQWSATFAGPGLPIARIHLDSDAAENFFLVRSGTTETILLGPLDEAPVIGDLDRRVGFLSELCEELLYGAKGYPCWYQLAIDLWHAAEEIEINNPKNQSI
jgi:predicted dehydrogenase